ncbi:MAG: protein-glutamate O-methyltransferase CheR [Anaeromicrobium sp.]|jgi:chemotaxis protein methyltransferase CheR|uniref:CheR family methyltransferase n=1 Tax=Anaeromicrobium sp. TaxID=1929132 RepID=UPI0025F2CB13|nr:protein-glutamate O-methyltransferase CheR [Anaeromicrobium sp.]MCT4593671.1 protein-glutamate O-methyltransferase CheR [Anaeromicrobium sp.]
MIKITDGEFRLLSSYIKEHSGINLKNEKKTLLVGRLSSILNELGIDNFMAYYKYLKNDTGGKELSRLIDKVTTNHTYFMREPEHFNYFSQIVLPYLKKTVTSRDLRIWCAASSTGEEPYTLAILMADFFKNEEHLWDKKLLATDLSLSVLKEAQRGNYNNEKISLLPKIWVLNYFNKVGNNRYEIKDTLKKEVIFRRFNLLEPVFPFKKKLHVIFCRNVMIYFDNDTKNELVEKMYDSLEYGGYLFIGHSESIDRNKTRFKYVKPAVYRKL